MDPQLIQPSNQLDFMSDQVYFETVDTDPLADISLQAILNDFS